MVVLIMLSVMWMDCWCFNVTVWNAGIVHCCRDLIKWLNYITLVALAFTHHDFHETLGGQ